MTRRTIRPDGKPLTKAEKQARWRAKKRLGPTPVRQGIKRASQPPTQPPPASSTPATTYQGVVIRLDAIRLDPAQLGRFLVDRLDRDVAVTLYQAIGARLAGSA